MPLCVPFGVSVFSLSRFLYRVYHCLSGLAKREQLPFYRQKLEEIKTFRNFALAKHARGEVLEWLKRHAWKACNRQNRFAGSNPVLSAR